MRRILRIPSGFLEIVFVCESIAAAAATPVKLCQKCVLMVMVIVVVARTGAVALKSFAANATAAINIKRDVKEGIVLKSVGINKHATTK